MAASAAAELGTGDARDLTRIADRAASESGGRVLVVDGTRGSLPTQETRPATTATGRRSRARSTDRIAQGRRFSDTLGESLLFTAVPIVLRTSVGGAVRVTQSVDAIEQEGATRIVLGLIGIGVIALVLGLAFAWFLAGTLARPLQRLAATARRVEAGDLGARASPRARRRLARSRRPSTT